MIGQAGVPRAVKMKKVARILPYAIHFMVSSLRFLARARRVGKTRN